MIPSSSLDRAEIVSKVDAATVCAKHADRLARPLVGYVVAAFACVVVGVMFSPLQPVCLVAVVVVALSYRARCNRIDALRARTHVVSRRPSRRC